MIDFVKGPFVYQTEQAVVVEAQGIGYQVFVAQPLSCEEGEQVFLFTHLVIRDDAHSLYGFLTKKERDLFRLLLEVSGVGPKVAIAMLASSEPKALITAIQLENLKFLTKMPGIGKKTAQRIILDLKDKLKKLKWELDPTIETADSSIRPPSISYEREAIDALIGLGYNVEEAEQAVETAVQQDPSSTEELIRYALQASMRK